MDASAYENKLSSEMGKDATNDQNNNNSILHNWDKIKCAAIYAVNCCQKTQFSLSDSTTLSFSINFELFKQI